MQRESGRHKYWPRNSSVRCCSFHRPTIQTLDTGRMKLWRPPPPPCQSLPKSDIYAYTHTHTHFSNTPTESCSRSHTQLPFFRPPLPQQFIQERLGSHDQPFCSVPLNQFVYSAPICIYDCKSTSYHFFYVSISCFLSQFLTTLSVLMKAGLIVLRGDKHRLMSIKHCGCVTIVSKPVIGFPHNLNKLPPPTKAVAF